MQHLSESIYSAAEFLLSMSPYIFIVLFCVTSDHLVAPEAGNCCTKLVESHLSTASHVNPLSCVVCSSGLLSVLTKVVNMEPFADFPEIYQRRRCHSIVLVENADS